MLLLSLDGSWIGTHLASLQPNDASLVPGMMTRVVPNTKIIGENVLPLPRPSYGPKMKACMT